MVISQAFTALSAAAYVAMGIIRSPALMFAAAGVLGFALSMPFGFLRGLISKGVSASRQGQSMAGVCAVQVFMYVLAPVVFNTMYTAVAAWWPGFCLVSMGALCTAGAATIGFLAVRSRSAQGSEASSLLRIPL